jgi:hypothetical protein
MIIVGTVTTIAVMAADTSKQKQSSTHQDCCPHLSLLNIKMARRPGFEPRSGGLEPLILPVGRPTRLVEMNGIEPLTLAMQARCSPKLSYIPTSPHLTTTHEPTAKKNCAHNKVTSILNSNMRSVMITAPAQWHITSSQGPLRWRDLVLGPRAKRLHAERWFLGQRTLSRAQRQEAQGSQQPHLNQTHN